MNLIKTPASLYRFIHQQKAWKTDRKIVVFESDDWGCVRTPSKEIYQKLIKAGIAVDKNTYSKYDTLESKDDMELLFDLLSRYKDSNNNLAIFTANSVVSNPDFKKIKESGFNEYYFEPFTETLKRKTDNSMDTWFDGMRNKVFHPQYHGRDHLNVDQWLKCLRRGYPKLITAFDYEVFGVSKKMTNEDHLNFMSAFAVEEASDYEKHKVSLEGGFQLFENIFGFKSESFIAPKYIWHPFHEKVLHQSGIRYLQGSFVQKVPCPGLTYKHKYHYMGQRNNNQQIYIFRNCRFEPSSNPDIDWVDHCLRDINRAFKNKKPAIICTHRVNFMSSIFPENRDKNLKLLDALLREITAKWKNVEFMTSDKLGKLIEKSHFVL